MFEQVGLLGTPGGGAVVVGPAEPGILLKRLATLEARVGELFVGDEQLGVGRFEFRLECRFDCHEFPVVVGIAETLPQCFDNAGPPAGRQLCHIGLLGNQVHLDRPGGLVRGDEHRAVVRVVLVEPTTFVGNRLVEFLVRTEDAGECPLVLFVEFIQSVDQLAISRVSPVEQLVSIAFANVVLVGKRFLDRMLARGSCNCFEPRGLVLVPGRGKDLYVVEGGRWAADLESEVAACFVEDRVLCKDQVLVIDVCDNSLGSEGQYWNSRIDICDNLSVLL